MKIDLLFNYQLRIYLSCLEKREGVASKLFDKEDKHVLLWDFDDVELEVVEASLTAIMKRYKLPKIYIVSSSPKRFHAYSFTARTFKEVIHILSATPELDVKYLRLGMVRGYYTLRITPRKNDDFTLVKILDSYVKDEVNPLDVSTSEYMTANKGGHGDA